MSIEETIAGFFKTLASTFDEHLADHQAAEVVPAFSTKPNKLQPTTPRPRPLPKEMRSVQTTKGSSSSPRPACAATQTGEAPFPKDTQMDMGGEEDEFLKRCLLAATSGTEAVRSSLLTLGVDQATSESLPAFPQPHVNTQSIPTN